MNYSNLPANQFRKGIVQLRVNAWPLDFNNDGKVNTTDITTVVIKAGPVTSANRRYDLNQDSKVNEADVAIVQAAYFKTCTN